MKDLSSNQTKLIVVAVLIFIVLAVGLGFFTFQMARQQSVAVAQVTPTSTATPLPTNTPISPPAIITNTPTPTDMATPTSTVTATPSPTFTPTPTPTPTPVVVINRINQLGRLETTEYAMQTVINLENEPANLWERIAGADQLMLIAEGEVIAGFDLEKVEEGDIQVQGRSVEITLPAPEILNSRIDNERTRVYKRDTGLFVSPDQTLESRARQLAEEALVEWALERDILERARSDGRLQIENLLRSLGFTDITINVEGDEL